MSTENPTIEDVRAEMSGSPVSEGAAEVTDSQPKADDSTPTATPAPTTEQPDFQAMIEQALKQHLAPIRSELGQFGKMRADLQRQSAQQKTPTSWDQLDPETRKTSSEIIRQAFLESEEGQLLERLKGDYSQREQMREIQSIDSIAQKYAGSDFKDLDPIMGKLYEQAQRASNQGDQDAQDFVNEIHSGSKSAVRVLVDLARAEHAKTFEASADKVKNDRADRAKRVGTTLTSNPSKVEATDWKANIPEDNEKALAYLKKMMIEQNDIRLGR